MQYFPGSERAMIKSDVGISCHQRITQQIKAERNEHGAQVAAKVKVQKHRCRETQHGKQIDDRAYRSDFYIHFFSPIAVK